MSSRDSRRGSGWLALALVEDRELVHAVQQLEPSVLADVVAHLGIADSGALLALATPEQLRGLADDDLWRVTADGSREDFDAERFGVWVEVLIDEGATVAADALVALDEDLLAHALGTHMLVLDLDELAPRLQAGIAGLDDPELVDKILESSLAHELDELLLVSLRYDGWDAIIDVIHELDRRDHALVRRLLDRVCAATMDRVSDDGLYSVLTEAESLAEDARGARDDRRERRGFLSVSDARAFLAGAVARGLDAGDDPVVRSYMRSYQVHPVTVGADFEALSSVLRAHGVVGAARALPSASAVGSATRDRLRELAARDPSLHQRRSIELVFLANAVLAAMSAAEPNRVEAVETVIALCDRGAATVGEAALDLHDLIALFGAGLRAASTDGGATGGLVARLLDRLAD